MCLCLIDETLNRGKQIVCNATAHETEQFTFNDVCLHVLSCMLDLYIGCFFAFNVDIGEENG